MILGVYSKQPAEVLDYAVDFSEFLPAGDYVASVAPSVEINPDPLASTTLVLGASIIATNGLMVTQWVSAGTSGQTYQVQLRATTHQGRVVEAEFRLRVKEI